MKIFAVADTHLSLADPKPMDIFGSRWENHCYKLAENWRERVTPEDWVLICGDISWAMHLEDARPDLEFLGKLTGQKIIVRGNHDYWWKSISKVRAELPAGMYALQNDFISLGDIAVCGTRGWTMPNGQMTPEDEKVYRREILRAKMSFEKASRAGFTKMIFMMHYPPFNNGRLDTEFGELFKEYSPAACVYGHLHGHDHRHAFEGTINGTRFHFVSVDFTGFSPLEIWPDA